MAPLILALLRTRTGELEFENGAKLHPATPVQAFVLAYVCGIIWYASTCYWIYDTMRQYGGLSGAMAVLVLFLFCCYLALYHGAFGLLFSLVAGRDRDIRWPLVTAPLLWVAVELARTRITAFPWNLLGTAQVDNVALCRIASWIGVYGISFEIVLVNVALAAAFLVPREKRSALLVAGLAAAAALQAGRLVEAPPAKADHSALLVQQNIPVAVEWTPTNYANTLRELTQLTTQFATAHPERRFDPIVWPESPAPFYTNDTQFRRDLSGMALASDAWVVAGSIGTAMQRARTDDPVFNSASLISPDGRWVDRYDKVHLVPFGEYLPFPRLFSFAGGLTKEVGQFERGTSRKPLDAGNTKLGVFICYESVFPDEVRQFAANGAQVFVNISNDGWYGDSGAYAQHLNQTRLRAIENNRWILSATDTGVTASIDPLGRVAARIPRKQRAALDAPYSPIAVPTFYTRHGDWFAYLCAIISVGTLVARFIHSNRKKVNAPS